MKVVKPGDVDILKTVHNVDVRKLYDKESAQVIHITLRPGESLRRHITPVDVAFYVIEGSGVVEIGDEKMGVGSDTLVESPANIVHCWYNEGSEILRFLVIKAPRPTKETKIL